MLFKLYSHQRVTTSRRMDPVLCGAVLSSPSRSCPGAPWLVLPFCLWEPFFFIVIEYNAKLAILINFKCTTQWPYSYTHCPAVITTVYFPKLFVLPNRTCSPVKQ